MLRNRMVWVASDVDCAVVTAGKLEKTASTTISRLRHCNHMFIRPILCYAWKIISWSRKSVMRLFARSVGLFLGVGIVFAGPSHAQDLSLFGQMPTTFEQCARERQERQLMISALRERIQQCLIGNPSGRFVSIPVCNYPGSITCADLEQQACVLSDANIERSRLCIDRAGEFQRQEAERERLESDRRRADEAAARDQERNLSMAARAAGRGDVALAASIARGGVVDPNDPTRAPRLLDSGGRYLANAMGVSTTPQMSVSGAISGIALNSYRDLGARALDELNSATGSGAFDVDGSSDTPSGPTLRFSTVNNSDITAALQSEAQAYADLWNNGGDIGRVIAVAAIAARIAAVMEDRPTSNADMARVSLVLGAFARSINTLTDAATRGEISLTDGTSPYTMVSRVAAMSARPAVSEPAVVTPRLPGAEVSQEARALSHAFADHLERAEPEAVNSTDLADQCIVWRSSTEYPLLFLHVNRCNFLITCSGQPVAPGLEYHLGEVLSDCRRW